jgi:hypothetical protein
VNGLIQMLCLIVLLGNAGLLLWIAITVRGLPQRTVNTRAIVAAIDQMRAAMELIGGTQVLDTEALNKLLRRIVEMLDVYVLRITPSSGGSRWGGV